MAGSACAGTAPAVGARVWRLNDRQYANTLATLFVGRSPQGASGLTRPVGVPVPFAERDTTSRFTTMASSFSMSELELEQVLGAAESGAASLMVHLSRPNASCVSQAAANRTCLQEIVTQKGELLFRRPLTGKEVAWYVASAGALPFKDGLHTALMAMLASPKFLFRNEVGNLEGQQGSFTLSPFQIAEALSYSLLDAPPDQALWEAARSGRLAGRDEVRAQARRLLASIGDNGKVSAFLEEYFRHSRADQVAKPNSGKDFKGFALQALIDDTKAFLAQVVRDSARGRFLENLLTTQTVFANRKSAITYGATVTRTDDQPEMLTRSDRSGILTQPSFLIANSQDDRNDPIKRGHFVRQELLCGTVPPINIDEVAPLSEDPKLTLREKLVKHTLNPTCAGCHQLMDPIGLTLEGYDHYGRARTAEVGRPVDISGMLTGSGDQDGPLAGAKELGERLARSSATHACVTRRTFTYFAGREALPADLCSLGKIEQAFRASGGSIAELIGEVMTSDAFLDRFTN